MVVAPPSTARTCPVRWRAASDRRKPATLAIFVDTINAWLSARLSHAPSEPGRTRRIAEAWDKINGAARDAHEYNLERKPLVFNVFGWLAEAARG